MIGSLFLAAFAFGLLLGHILYLVYADPVTRWWRKRHPRDYSKDASFPGSVLNPGNYEAARRLREDR